MKKTIRRSLAAALALMLVLGCVSTAFAADSGITTVQVEVTYGQTGARSMLALINEFRTGDDAWYWNSDNSEKVVLTGLEELTYDYTLEQVAMQRAAEIALNFQHTRPNGASCSTAFTAVADKWSAYGENIAVGYTSAEAVFTAWQETDRPYPNQGHRINMLSGYNVVGIAHVVYHGVDYWVQEFATLPTIHTAAVPANDSAALVSVEVADSMITSVTLTQPAALELEVGGSVVLPEVEANLLLKDSLIQNNRVTVTPGWSIDSGIAELSDGKLTAKAVGNAALTAVVLGQTVSVPVTVTPVSLSSAEVTLDQDSYSYTGKAITPKPTVVLSGVVLTEGTDYNLTYEDNTEVGTASVIVTGTGSYTGFVTKQFTITPCSHQWDSGSITRQPTCGEEGILSHTCTLCGAVKTEAIAKLFHTPVTDEAVAPTCTGTGLTEGSHCGVCCAVLTEQEIVDALGHDWDDGVVTEPATCTQDGVKTYTCERCGETRTEESSAVGHSYTEWTAVTAPTCTEDGSEARECTACGYVETRGIDAAGHDWETEYTIDQVPTCTEDGSKSIHCKNCSAVRDAEVVPALGHHWDDGAVIAAAACSEDGLERFTCTVCGESRDEVLSAVGHNWDEGVVLIEATCIEDGLARFTCTVCGENREELIPAAGHDFADWVIIREANCTEDGSMERTCRICGLTEAVAICAASHDLVLVPAQPATHTSGGNIACYVCSVCGACYADENAAQLLNAEDVILPMQPHTFSDGWTADAVGHWHDCTAGDGAVSDYAGHTFSEWTVTAVPTETLPGFRTHSCTICGYQETEQLPPDPSKPEGAGSQENTEPKLPEAAESDVSDTTGDKNTASVDPVGAASPQTGDETHSVIAGVLLALSAVVLALIALPGRHRAKR